MALQEETWGRGFSERVSPAILKVSQILGGVSAGAYDADDKLMGFVFGMTGVVDGELAHWSDMLAVRPEARDRGLGRRLKAYQRDEMLALGVSKVFWTFDPLQARNAHLNFNRLGIVVRRYERDMYGQTDSPLHRGIGTDRFIALWLIDSDRVRARLETDAPEGRDATDAPEARHAVGAPGRNHTAGAPPMDAIAAALSAADGHDTVSDLPTPGEPVLDLGNEWVSVSIPSDVNTVMDRDMDLALRWRGTTREALVHYLTRGYEVREFVAGDAVCRYLLNRDRLEDA